MASMNLLKNIAAEQKMRIPVCLIALIFTFLSSSPASAGLTIQNMAQAQDKFYVSVEYENDTENTYNQITIKCEALDKSENIINHNEKSFTPGTDTQISPGFKWSVKLPIYVNDKKVNSAYCNSEMK